MEDGLLADLYQVANHMPRMLILRAATRVERTAAGAVMDLIGNLFSY